MDAARDQFSTAPDSLPQAKLRSPGFFRLLPPSSFSSKPQPMTISDEHVKLVLRSKGFVEDNGGIQQSLSAEQAGTKACVSTDMSCPQQRPIHSHPKPTPDSAATDPSVPWQRQSKAERTASKVCDQSSSSSSNRKTGGDATSKLDVKPTLQNEKTVVTEQSQTSQTQMKQGIKAGKKSQKFLLSSGKQLHISSGEVQDSVSGNRDKWTQHTTGGLKHDNYYNLAASGLCAIATVKPQWEYEEETGKKKFERSLQETQLGKVTKHLEYYNTGFTKKEVERSVTAASACGSSQSPPVQPSAQQKSAAAETSSHEKVLCSMPVASPARKEMIHQPQTQTTAIPCQHQNGTEPQSSKMETSEVTPPRASKAVVKASSSKARPSRTLNPPFPSRSGHALPTPRSTSTLQNGDTPQQDLLTAPTITTTATGTEPRLEAYQVHSSRVAGHQHGTDPLNDSGGEGLNDLSEAPGSTSSAGDSGVAMGVHIGGEVGTSSSTVMTGGASEKPTTSRDKPSEYKAIQMDTRNDTAIAKVLQAEEEAQAGLPLAPPPSSSGSQAARDYKLALVMQEECDAEMASRMQHEEREMAGGGSYGYSQRPRYDSSYREQTDRTNVLPYSPSPRDNNAPYRLRSRGSPTNRQRTEHGHHGDGWQPGLGIIAASHDPPRPAPVQRNRAGRERGGDGSGPEDVNMSYESLLELQDIPRGLDMAAITRLSTVSLYNPVAKSGSETGEESKKCCICLQDFEMGQQLRSLPCIHSFHRHCIDKWLQQNRMCPVCQKDIQEMVS